MNAQSADGDVLGTKRPASVDNGALSTERHRCHLRPEDHCGQPWDDRDRLTLRKRHLSPFHRPYYDYYFCYQPPTERPPL